MSDFEKIKAILPFGENLSEEIKEELILGNRHLVLEWDENGDIKNWGIL